MSIRDYYESYWSETGFNPHGAMDESLRDALQGDIVPGKECLDVGCGDGGGLGAWLKSQGAIFTGVDISENAVAQARSVGLNVIRVDGLERLPFEDNQYELVTCTEVFEHLFDPISAARELERVCRVGGKVFVTVPNIAYWRSRLDALVGRWNPLGDQESVSRPWRDPHIRFFTAASLARMMGAAGFNKCRVYGRRGRFVGDIPLMRRIKPDLESSRGYRQLEELRPSLFGYRLYAEAIKGAL